MDVLLYLAAGSTALWGIAHLCATRGVVRGFGELTPDNRHIITMEWIVEGVALVALGAFIATVTAVGHRDSGGAVSEAATAVYATAIATLVVLAVVSLFTGFRVKFLPFRLCPVIFILSAMLVALGAWI